jgi:hypothetical protein
VDEHLASTSRPDAAPDLRQRLDAGTPQGVVAVGTVVAAGRPLPAAGVWVLEPHAGDDGECPCSGRPRALAAGQVAPACPGGHRGVWRLAHLAPSAADEGDVER